jgi:hypothetical protein
MRQPPPDQNRGGDCEQNKGQTRDKPAPVAQRSAVPPIHCHVSTATHRASR